MQDTSLLICVAYSLMSHIYYRSFQWKDGIKTFVYELNIVQYSTDTAKVAGYYRDMDSKKKWWTP